MSEAKLNALYAAANAAALKHGKAIEAERKAAAAYAAAHAAVLAYKAGA